MTLAWLPGQIGQMDVGGRGGHVITEHVLHLWGGILIEALARSVCNSPGTRGRMRRAPKESPIQLSKSHYPTPLMEFADTDDNYGDLCDNKTKISPT